MNAHLGRRVLGISAAAVAAPASASTAYLATLSVLSVAQRRRSAARWPAVQSSGSAATPRSGSVPSFVIVVPAHDEADGIADTIASLQALDHDASRYRILVVADNCSDDTAVRAARAGADVLVRHDVVRRGKGHALAAGFAAALDDPDVDAVVVVDADTLVDPGLLRAASDAMARGELVMQADYRVRDPRRSWRTMLLEIAFTAMHTVRSEGRERLGLSVGLRGNGMVFTREALARSPHVAVGLVEDAEYATRLLQHGMRVAHLSGVAVRGAMPAGAGAAASQRVRWEEGRRRLRRSALAGLLAAATRQRSVVLADGVFELAAPPLGRTATVLAGTAAVAASVRRRDGGLATAVTGVGLVGLGVHVAIAWARSGTGVAGLAALGRAPLYVAWKVTLRGQRRTVDRWIRTARTEEPIAA